MANLIKGDEQDKTIIFLHIPKAAGSTLHRIIERQYEPVSIFSINGLRVQESIAEFKELSESRKKQIRMLKGHMKFGIHKYLPQQSTYITILREPVERIISQYYYILRTPHHYLYNKVTSKRMSLKDYICSGVSKEIYNGQTRTLTGADQSVAGLEQCSAEVLESAKKNLQENFAVVGLSEKFDETLLLLRRIFEWRTPFYMKENVTKKRPLKENISRDTLSLIQKCNELDIELYRYAKEMFEELISQSVYFSEAELKQFKLLNRTYGKAYSFYSKFSKKAKLLTNRNCT